MTINREQLVRLLTEKTDMTQDEVEQQLDELTSRILEAANRGKALEIKGFGLFYFDESGELAFRASDQLDREINFNYAGMEPVELDPSRTPGKTQAGATDGKSQEKEEEDDGEDPEETVAEDDVFGIGKTLSGSVDEDADPEPFGKLFGEEPIESEADDSPGATAEKQEEPKKAGTAPAAKTRATAKKVKQKKARDPMTTIILVVVAAVVLFIGYFVITDLTQAPESQTAGDTEQVEEPDDPPASTEQDITEAVEPDELSDVEEPAGDSESDSNGSGSGEDQTRETQPESEEQETQSEPYGLYGDLSDTDGRIYTIVVHSLRRSSVAEETADDLRDEGYRTSVRERSVDGRTVYRVGIGQFPDIETAQKEAAGLPEPYKNQHFIQRLQ